MHYEKWDTPNCQNLTVTCHYSLRSNILQSIGSQQEQYNFSVAYDWQFKGFTGKMIRQMNEFTLKINIDNRNHGRDNLALHEHL